jgi:ribosomal protein S18 acetylase RimI-like enzyme
MLQADTLLYFSGSTAQAKKSDGGEIAVTSIRPDPDELEEFVRISFDGYSNHYAANPSLPPDAVMEGYAEWARDLLDRQANVMVSAMHGNDTASFIVGHPVGEVRSQKSFEVALNGTHPSFRNRGIYQILLRHLMSELRLQGIETVWISTQASNSAMIRTWEKLGLRFEFAVNTLHCYRQKN